jgi:hypothetical protein
MELINATKMEAGFTMGLQPDGRELLVVVVKGTFTIPKSGETSQLAEEQVPLVESDVFTGEPGLSAPLYEIDFAPRKPRCDVLLNGSAYTPGSKPAARVRVSLKVGSWAKSFDVVGNRVWQAGALYLKASNPEPFTVLPISYNNAFGGIDRSQEDPKLHRWYPQNYAGVGYHEYLSAKYLDGKPLPNTEETGNPVSKPNGKYLPMAFGPLGRAWQQRIKLAGTYDQKWIDTKAPFLPDDFQEAYYQAAPADQQRDYLRAGEEVELVNLTPQGRTVFKLPAMKVPFEFYYKNDDRKKMVGVIDTLVLEPDKGRFMLSSRACLPLRRSLHELKLVVAGRMPGEWYAERGLEKRPSGKPRFKSVAALAVWRRTRERQRSERLQ